MPINNKNEFLVLVCLTNAQIRRTGEIEKLIIIKISSKKKI